jgi:hypothetical protein
MRRFLQRLVARHLASPLDFALAFRYKWFEAMSGGASVPFAFAAVFLDNSYGKAICTTMAFVCGGFAAYRVWKRERETVIDLQKKLENPIPDVVINSPHPPDVVQRIPNDKRDNHPGIFFIFRNIRIINKDPKSASIECNLIIRFAEWAYIRCSQIEPWQENRDDSDARLPAALGERIPKVLNIEGRKTVEGYFAFFIADGDMPTVSPMLKIATQGKETNKTPLETISKLPFVFEVTEHLSGLQKGVDASSRFSCYLRNVR